jgi:exodeoxyribonuclease VII small subunit
MPRATPTTPMPDNATQAATPDVPLPATYELALSELEQLVSSMENAALPLDRLLVSYRRAADLLTFCRSRLTAVEAQVKVLEDGQLKPWIAQP